MTQDTPDARFAARMGALLGPDFPSDIALAVSGGGDSMAMLALAHGWARVFGVRLWVVTVDHGLRADSAAEAAMVAAECAGLGHPHATLRWQWDGQGNLQDAARQARLSLIDRWRGGLDHVLFAHTRDDVAETFVMRLARGSGVEGLSAMAAKRRVIPHVSSPSPLDPAQITARDLPPPRRGKDRGFHVLRPLLDETRADLRHYLKTLHIPHVDDPSNDDPRFDRVRARRLIAVLSDAGLTADMLAQTAGRLRRARPALAARAAQVAEQITRQDMANATPTGDLLIARDGFQRIERDTQLRLLAGALQWVSSQPYRPRAAALEVLLDRALGGAGGTLQGCELRVDGSDLRVMREFGAIAALRTTAGPCAVFDTRFALHGSDIDGLTLRALGPDGWAQIPEKTEDAPPFHAARSLPAVFDGETLVACAALAFGPQHRVDFRPPAGSFKAFLLCD